MFSLKKKAPLVESHSSVATSIMQNITLDDFKLVFIHDLHSKRETGMEISGRAYERVRLAKFWLNMQGVVTRILRRRLGYATRTHK